VDGPRTSRPLFDSFRHGAPRQVARLGHWAVQPRQGRRFGKGFVCFIVSEVWWRLSRVKKHGAEDVAATRITNSQVRRNLKMCAYAGLSEPLKVSCRSLYQGPR